VLARNTASSTSYSIVSDIILSFFRHLAAETIPAASVLILHSYSGSV